MQAYLLDNPPKGVKVWSVSQIGAYARCPMLWAMTYLGGVRPPPSPAQENGSNVHKLLENWLRRREPFDASNAGRVAFEMAKNLPDPMQEHVEEKLFVEIDGIVFVAVIDLLTDNAIYDHKTCSSFRYVLNEDSLVKDPQACLYSAAYQAKMGKYPRLQWTYGATRGAPSARSLKRLPLSDNEVESGLLGLLSYAGKAASIQDVESAEMNHKACRMYGGCAFEPQCFPDMW